MKAFFLLVLVFGLAMAKPYENVEEFFEDDDEFANRAAPTQPEPSKPKPSKPEPSTPESSGPEPSTPESSVPEPSKKPEEKDLWSKFAHFLLTKSVEGVKPDEHPDRKYIKPGEELVAQLLVIKKEVVKAIKGPVHDIIKLMKEDHEEMMKRVHKAVEEKNIAGAKHVVGEYFIAINRRFASLFIEAHNKGLFDKIGDEDDSLAKVKREFDDHVQKAHMAALYILKNFNEYRVSDGLLDAPFVRLGIETAKAYRAAYLQLVKNAKVGIHVYTDMVADMVRLSLEEHNHDAAIQRAGSGVLSFIRRKTKIIVALHRMYGPKQCHGPGPKRPEMSKKGLNPKISGIR